MGALNVSSTGTIDMGAVDTDFTFASLTGVTTSLAITNFTSGTDTITFTDSSNLTEANLAKITVNGAASGLGSSGQLVAASASTAPLSLVVTPGNGNLTLTFNAPASSGGRAVTGYKFSTDGGSTWSASTGTTSTTIVASGLLNGTSYNVQVRAVTAFGDGTATSSVSGTPRTVPTVSTGSATSITTTTVTLGGSITATGGNNSTERGIFYSTTNNFADGAGTKVSESGDYGAAAYTINVTGLASGTVYYFKAFATNAAGTSYGTQGTFTTSAGTLAAPTLSFATMPSNSANITINWADITGETSYELMYSTNSTWVGNTTVTGIAANSTSYTVDVGAVGTYFFRVRGNGTTSGTWSNAQLNQLRSVASGATIYLAPAGTPLGGDQTVLGVFGNNTSGLVASTTESVATCILLTNNSGATTHTLFYHSSAGEWRGAGNGTTNMGSTAMSAGRAFMLKNNSDATDFILLNAEPRTAPLSVSVPSAAGQVNLLTPARSVPTSLSNLNLANATLSSNRQVKPATIHGNGTIEPRTADRIIIPQSNGSTRIFYHDGTNWRRGYNTINASDVNVEAGGAFFIQKATGSSFDTYDAPAE
jgi:hypothetical protein